MHCPDEFIISIIIIIRSFQQIKALVLNFVCRLCQ